jgi:threonine dehydratase
LESPLTYHPALARIATQETQMIAAKGASKSAKKRRDAGISTPLPLGAYLQKILTARVYDVAIETPLEPARSLSKRVSNHVLLKR